MEGELAELLGQNVMPLLRLLYAQAAASCAALARTLSCSCAKQQACLSSGPSTCSCVKLSSSPVGPFQLVVTFVVRAAPRSLLCFEPGACVLACTTYELCCAVLRCVLSQAVRTQKALLGRLQCLPS